IGSMENEQCDKLTMEQDEIADVTKNKSDFHLSLFSIIFTNLLLMAVALSAGLSITQLIWVYWCGGVFVGLFRALKVLSKVDSSDDKIEGGLAVFFLALQSFSIWIYCIEPAFDYVHGLLVMGAIILPHELFLYLRDSRPWYEPDDLKNALIENGIFLFRFVPIIALYHFIVKTQAGEWNMTLLTVEFMLFKLASDVIIFFIEGHLLKKATQI
ncbi:MAG: hypothetical protein ACO20W_09100, partial [Anaerohalosphaeraceae bacterium]